MTSCPHLHATIYTRIYAMETRYQPAEYESRAQCDDCGKWMNPQDLPEEAETKETK